MTVQITIGGAIALALLAFVLGALRSAASSILADEFKSSAPAMSRWVVRLAARFIPQAHREDQLETWLAEIDELKDRPLAALRYALVNGLIAAPFLARQLQPSLLPAPQRANKEMAPGSNRVPRSAKSSPNPAGMVRDLFAQMTALVTAIVAMVLALGSRFASTYFFELLGPYDHSRVARSVVQLLLKVVMLTIGMVALISAGFSAIGLLGL